MLNANANSTSPGTTGIVLHRAFLYDAFVWLVSLGREHSFREKTLDLASLKPGESVLDIGCGTGTIAIAAKRRVGAAGSVYGVDASPEMLARAAKKAIKAGAEVVFKNGMVEALPFPDNAYDCVFSVTALEECDADRAIAEMTRVAKPGGRVGVVVRAVDMPQWWNVAVPEAMREKITTTPFSVSPKGVADASLYRRMRGAGLRDLVCYPTLVTLDRPEGPIWRFREDHVLSLFTAEETELWQNAREAARGEGLLIAAHPMHCAVGTKP